MTGSRVVLARKMLASIASAAMGTVIALEFLRSSRRWHGAELVMMAVVCAVPFVAAGMVWSARLTWQLLARGAWWSMLLVGGLGALMSGDGRFLAINIGSATALLGAGQLGLDGGGGRFQPVAFRGTLLLALVLAIADTGVFLYCGVALVLDEQSVLMALLVLPMAAGIVGLLRLRTWGLLVGAISNVLVVVLAATGVLPWPSALRRLFIGTACLQLLVPVPMLVSIARRRKPDPDGWRRTKTVAVAAVILGIVGVSVYAVLAHVRLGVRYQAP